MKDEERSLGNDGNMLVSKLPQLVEYYTHSSTLKGLEGKLFSVPNNNIISIPICFWWIFLLSLEKSQIQGISHCQPSSCIYGKNTRKNMYDMLKIFWTFIRLYNWWVENNFIFVQGTFLGFHWSLCSIYIR